MRKLSLISAFALLSALSAAGQDVVSDSTESVGGGIITEKFAIYYRFDKIDIDTAYLDNPRQIEHIVNYLQKSERIDSITIHAWASPEGAYHHNRWLSAERAKAARRFLLKHTPDSTRLNAGKIKISPLAENWPGLLDLVEKHYTRHDREKVLGILRTEGIGDETRKWRLKQLDGGYTWNYLVRRYMPELRAATWICVWEKVAEYVEPLPMTEDSVDVLYSPLKAVTVMQSYPASDDLPVSRVPVAALRTNLLVPGLNFGVEVPVGNSWSVGADYYFPWIPRKWDRKNCFQLLGVILEGRYWFGTGRTETDRLEGHSLGFSVSGGYYDMERNFTGHQGEFASVGVDYLYSLPICNDRLHLEFTVGAGYLYSYARPYDVFEPGGKAFKEGYVKNVHWLGPLKAGVSLVIPITAKRRAGR